MQVEKSPVKIKKNQQQTALNILLDVSDKYALQLISIQLGFGGNISPVCRQALSKFIEEWKDKNNGNLIRKEFYC